LWKFREELAFTFIIMNKFIASKQEAEQELRKQDIAFSRTESMGLLFIPKGYKDAFISKKLKACRLLIKHGPTYINRVVKCKYNRYYKLID